MNNKVITTQGNVQFQFPDGKIVNVHPNHIYTAFNEDTVSFILVALPKSSGLSTMTSKAEDLELNGAVYSFAELPNAVSEAFAIAGAQARCEIVDELPESGYTNTIYLVPQPAPQTGFDEYVYILDQGWELIGDTSIEMDNYVLKTVFSGYTADTAVVLNGLRTDVDTTSGNVITETERALLAESGLSDAIDAEETAREAADGVISGAVDTVSSGLTQEVQRAQNAESGLSDAIAAEEARAIAAENEKTVTISLTQAEYDALPSSAKTDATKLYVISDAQPIDLSVYAKVSALTEEISARTDADTALDNKINAVSAATDAALALKLDASAYTVDSSVIENSVNPVQGGALYDELRIEGEQSETTLEWDNHDGGETTNYPNGVSTIKIEVVDGSESGGNAYSFFDENYEQLGYITVNYNDGDVTVGSDYVNVTYSISGNVVTINYPTIAANVTAIGSAYDNIYTIKAIGESSVISVKDQVFANTAAIDTKQPLLQAGENIIISGNVISAEGGGKAIEAGRGISVTTGETADTVSFDLDIYNHTGSTIGPNIEIFGHPYADKGISTNKINNKSMYEFIVGDDNIISGSGKVTYGTIIGLNNKIISDGNTRYAYIFGAGNVLSGINLEGSTLIGEHNSGYTYYEFAAGYANECKNQAEVALGKYNVSSSATTSMEFGDSGNTLFSVGNGTANNARHNAFEIRQNGDIYLTKDGQDVKLQDQLGGGGGGGTVESAITSGSTNAVESKAIWSATTYNKEVTLQWSGYNSTNYPQGCTKIKVENITSRSNNNIIFNDNGTYVGRITINNFDSISVENYFDGATYEIDGTTVIISYPTITNITSINVSENGRYTYKAIVEGAWIADSTYMKSEVDAIQNTLQNNINSKLDATAYTPTVVDSALNVASTNPVENQALYSELILSDGGETETTIEWSGDDSTNYPQGCTKIKVEDITTNSQNTITFNGDNWANFGNITINNWGSISVDTSHFQGATYQISGTTVIISYPTVTTVTKLNVSSLGTRYTYKAITTGAPTTLKDQVVANTTALGGLSLVKLTQAQYDALATKDSNTLYVIVN